MRHSVILAMTLCLLSERTHAQATTTVDRTWVASYGDNSNLCTQASPCRSFQVALNKTNAFGEITCLDSGQFGDLYLLRSLTINCEGLVASSAVGTTGISFVVSPTATTDKIVLRGIDVHATNNDSVIRISGSGTVILDKMKVTSNSANGNHGISFSPSGPGKLVVSNSHISLAGGGTSGAGILIKPTNSGTAQVTIENVVVTGNSFGIAADGTGSAGGINMTVSNSIIASNAQDGILATSSPGNAPIGVLLTNVKSTNNGYGVRSIGSNVTVRMESSQITGNVTGLAALSGGALLSAGNNFIQANGTNGSFTGAAPLQ